MGEEKKNFQDERPKEKNLCVVQTFFFFFNNLLKVFKLCGDSFLKVLMIDLQGVIRHIFDHMRNT